MPLLNLTDKSVAKLKAPDPSGKQMSQHCLDEQLDAR